MLSPSKGTDLPSSGGCVGPGAFETSLPPASAPDQAPGVARHPTVSARPTQRQVPSAFGPPHSRRFSPTIRPGWPRRRSVASVLPGSEPIRPASPPQPAPFATHLSAQECPIGRSPPRSLPPLRIPYAAVVELSPHLAHRSAGFLPGQSTPSPLPPRIPSRHHHSYSIFLFPATARRPRGVSSLLPPQPCRPCRGQGRP